MENPNETETSEEYQQLRQTVFNLLLESRAVDPKVKVTLSSGKLATGYANLRETALSSEQSEMPLKLLELHIRQVVIPCLESIGRKPNCVGTVPMGGLLWIAQLLAFDTFQLPLFLVSKEPDKDDLHQRRVFGDSNIWQLKNPIMALYIEDVVTTGSSVLQVIEAARMVKCIEPSAILTMVLRDDVEGHVENELAGIPVFSVFRMSEFKEAG